MTKDSKKVHLIHGDSDYLIFKELQSLKKDLESKNTNITEFYGSKDLNFDEIFNALHTSDLFMTSSSVVIRGLTDGRSFFGFVENLIDYLNSKPDQQNDLYIFNSSKVTKVSRIFKSITKYGEVKEFTTPKPNEILKLIKQSLPITDEAGELLIQFSNSNLFLIKNEIAKLRNYLEANKKKNIETEDIELLCIKNINQNEIWSIGDKFLNYVITKDSKIKFKLLKEIDNLIDNNIPMMQILYSFYQYTLNGIKLKLAVKEGKDFKECMSLGYFFTKEFFPKKDKLNLDELFSINSKLLNYEYRLKSGEIEEVLGLRGMLISI